MNGLFDNAAAPVPLEAQIAEVERELEMRAKVYPRWVADKKMSQGSADAKVAAMRAVLGTLKAFANPPRHRFWGAGEADCPAELKAPNGELHTLRCKVCGTEDPRDTICRAAISGADHA